MKKTSFFLLMFVLFYLLYVSGSSVKASEYDIYVDQNYDKDNSDGSSNKPYQTIGNAIKESGSKGKKIYVKKGTYSETFTLKNGIELYGQSRDKTIVKGIIESEGDNLIKNLTVTGKSYGIVSLGRIEIENCKIKNSSKIGIDLSESDKKATITNSIISGNGKGFYVQRKRSVLISGNSVYENQEEGIDIREKVSGTISNNEIYKNGEGGIEFIVGGSNIKISENSIKKNEASGIASQFYSFIERTGSIDIKNNTINNNGKYGLACGIPSGGNPSGSYWNDSINLKDNTIENNKIEAVDNICNMIRVIDEEEEKGNVTLENKNKIPVPEESVSDKMIEDKENSEIKEKIIQERLIENIDSNQKILLSSEEEMNKIDKKNKIIIFFFGINSNELSPVREKIPTIKNQVEYFKNILVETKDEENKKSAEEATKSLEAELEKIKKFLEDKENKFSLFRWITKLF